MRITVGTCSARHLIKAEVVESLIRDDILDRSRVTFQVVPGLPLCHLRDALDEILRRGIKVEVDTNGFVFFPEWQPWRGIEKGTHLHGVRFTRDN